MAAKWRLLAIYWPSTGQGPLLTSTGVARNIANVMTKPTSQPETLPGSNADAILKLLADGLVISGKGASFIALSSLDMANACPMSRFPLPCNPVTAAKGL